MEQIFGLNNNIKFINFIITSLNDTKSLCAKCVDTLTRNTYIIIEQKF